WFTWLANAKLTATSRLSARPIKSPEPRPPDPATHSLTIQTTAHETKKIDHHRHRVPTRRRRVGMVEQRK
ncbi:MAG: hypothetical protein ACK49X_04780, partial [Akkermansiaceae bacterium]